MLPALRSSWNRLADAFVRLGSWVDARSDRATCAVGGLLIAIGFAANPRVLGPLITSDGTISTPRSVALIVLFEVFCAVAGLLLALRPALGRGWIRDALTSLGREWLPGLATPSDGKEVRQALALKPESHLALWEWVFLFALVVGALTYWSGQYNFYYVPNADWGSFDQSADDLWSGEMLSNLKRLPAFPFILGLVAKFIDAEPARFHAALGVNMALSAGCLVLIYLICRRCIGWLAVAPTVLTAAHKHFTLWAVQPIGEPSILFFLLLTIFLFQKRSRWQYAAAFAASMTRYDAMPIIPIIFFANVCLDRPWTGFRACVKAWRHWLKHLILTVVASAGIILWVGLIVWSALPPPDESGPDNRPEPPYIRLIQQGLERASVWPAVSTMTEPFDIPWGRRQERFIGFGIVCTLFALGLYASLGLPLPGRLRGPRFRRDSVVIFMVFFALLIFHVIFGVNRKRYTYLSLWIVQFYAVVGATCGLSLIVPELLRSWNRYSGIVGGVVMGGGAVWMLAKLRERILHVQAANAGAFYVAFACLLLILLLCYCIMRFRERIWILLPIAAFIIGMVGVPAVQSVRRYAGGTLRVKYKKYEYLLAGRWLLKNLQPGERAILSNTGMLKHHSGGRIDKEVTGLKYIDAKNHDELITTMRDGNIRYLIFTPRAELYDEDRQKSGKYLKWNIFLLQPFKGGKEPPGFRKIHTFPIYESATMRRGYVYELIAEQPSRN